jgi:hypothetical protein
MNQFIASAVAEKVGALRTVGDFSSAAFRHGVLGSGVGVTDALELVFDTVQQPQARKPATRQSDRGHFLGP